MIIIVTIDCYILLRDVIILNYWTEFNYNVIFLTPEDTRLWSIKASHEKCPVCMNSLSRGVPSKVSTTRFQHDMNFSSNNYSYWLVLGFVLVYWLWSTDSILLDEFFLKFMNCITFLINVESKLVVLSFSPRGSIYGVVDRVLDRVAVIASL